ncbi:secretion system protein E [Pandoraea terrae]|uniref:Secretion system protein E n=1 Tax=Pandoraea terrae TaxID=1537710 RepID=A0A5E4YQG8_9BURK|nr:GspE/PulE family protein [Pandoraea terrae]VVE51041.1 secretion system protein E [Pandoraea terrae]
MSAHPFPNRSTRMPVRESASAPARAAPVVGQFEADAGVHDTPSIGALLDRILHDALTAGASDIHLEPFEHRFRVRLRIDGQLRERADVPAALRDMLPTRLKVLANLDIAERRLPQDGQMLWRQGDQAVECRVSSLPTLHGEKLVIRLLDAAKVPLDLSALGYLPTQRTALANAIAHPYGLVLVTGPTGSGKSVSLYSCLRCLNTVSRNIATVEDPVEIRLPGVNQVNVNARTGLTFAVALRAFLRQDPDVLMIGEIRDGETAAIAVQAAQTGHLVLATVHANDAPSTIARLFDLGVAPFNLGACLRLVSAQRLVRRRCPARCVPGEAVTPCGYCDGSGASGRTGIYQVMPVSEAVARLIAAARPTQDIAAQAAADGVLTLREAGLARSARGEVWRDDVLAATLS